MAGKFYTLQETMEKLGKGEEEIKVLVREGRLREYRSGPESVYDPKEVNAVLGDTSQLEAAEESLGVELLPDESGNEVFLEEITKQEDTAIGDLSQADTSVGTTGINVLGETDDEYKLSDDTKGDTEVNASGLGDLDEDMNLDSVGSGSGLLDLSLQADDTSLGAVLDDILPTAGEDAGAQGDDFALEEASVAEEADKIFEEDEPEIAMPSASTPGIVQYMEVEPDAVSNACAAPLFLAFLALIYAAIVLSAATIDVVPVILRKIEPIIWYIGIGLAVVAIAFVGIAALKGPKKPKSKKADVYQGPGKSS